MRLTWLPDVQARPRHVALGVFDGVHLGHREVIRGADTVLTFEPHPRTVLDPDRAPRRLTPLPVKADLIAGLGVEELIVIPFDAAYARHGAEEFIAEVLVGALRAHTVSVGENFRFGHRALGDVGLLRRQDAFATRVAPMVALDGRVVSSSAIRQLMAEGDVLTAAQLLGAPFLLRGEVVAGDRRGRTLGYPTANIVPAPDQVVPANGVYACHATIADRPGELAAAVSVGLRPTFQTALGLLVEAYLLDFDDDIYGRQLTLSFGERLRGEVRYDGAQALIAQMDRDVEHVRRSLSDVCRTGGRGGTPER
jgi:riboflavin kinase/FMN adenylyltransferase